MIKLPIIGNDFGELEENRNKFILYIKVDKERYSTPALGGKMRGGWMLQMDDVTNIFQLFCEIQSFLIPPS